MTWSLSARRAWIEIEHIKSLNKSVKSLSARRAWIEINKIDSRYAACRTSLSARRAWIEISVQCRL